MSTPWIFEMDKGKQELVQSTLGTGNMRNWREENSQTQMPLKENSVSKLGKKTTTKDKHLRLYWGESQDTLFHFTCCCFFLILLMLRQRVNILFHSNSTNRQLQILASNWDPSFKGKARKNDGEAQKRWKSPAIDVLKKNSRDGMRIKRKKTGFRCIRFGNNTIQFDLQACLIPYLVALDCCPFPKKKMGTLFCPFPFAQGKTEPKDCKNPSAHSGEQSEAGRLPFQGQGLPQDHSSLLLFSR